MKRAIGLAAAGVVFAFGVMALAAPTHSECVRGQVTRDGYECFEDVSVPGPDRFGALLVMSVGGLMFYAFRAT